MDQLTLKSSKAGLTLPSGKVISYGEVLKDYDRIKQISPIDFHEPFGIQRDFISCDSKMQMLFGGNRSGKTEIVANKVLRACLDKPNQRWWVAGETFQDSIAIQQSKFWSLVPRNKIKYGSYDQINGFTNRKLLFKNRSLIIFKSYDQKRESFQGDQVDGVWLDEECPFDIFQECKVRLIDRDGFLLISMTSLKGVTDLVENIYEDSEVITSKYASLIDEEAPRIAQKGDIRIFFLWTTENIHIPQHRVEQEAQLMTKEEIRSRIYGLPTNLTGKIYPSMSKDVHVCKFEDLPEGSYQIDMVLDPHDRKPWAMCWIAIHSSNTAYVIEEYPEEKNFNEMMFDDKTYDDYVSWIKAKERRIKETFDCSIRRRILDPNFGNKTVQLATRQGGQSTTTPKKELAKRGLVFKDGIDSLEAGHLCVREWLFYLRADNSDEIVVQPKLMFVDYCQNAIRHHLRYSRKDITTPDGDVKDKVAPKEKYKDFCDVVRYWCMSKPDFQEDDYEEDTRKLY